MPENQPQTIYPFACNFFFLGAQIWVIAAGSNYSFTLRIAWMFILSAVVLILFPYFAEIGGQLGFWIVFAYLFFFSIIQGIGNATVYQLCGDLPAKYMGAVMIGTGISGIASNVMRALSLVIWPVTVDPASLFNGVLAYCISAALFLLCCGIGHFILVKNKFALFYLWQHPGFYQPEFEKHDEDLRTSTAGRMPYMLKEPESIATIVTSV